jgi:hypothetical protein
MIYFCDLGTGAWVGYFSGSSLTDSEWLIPGSGGEDAMATKVGQGPHQEGFVWDIATPMVGRRQLDAKGWKVGGFSH